MLQLQEVPVFKVYAGRFTSVAVGQLGATFVWGRATGGALGLPATGGDVCEPTLVHGLTAHAVTKAVPADTCTAFLTSKGCAPLPVPWARPLQPSS